VSTVAGDPPVSDAFLPPEWRWDSLRFLGTRGWARAAVLATLTAAAIAVPTRLVATPLFTRMTPPRAFDYPVLAVTSALVGLTISLGTSTTADLANRRALAGGATAYVAVGCPLCNRVVVALLGSAGALGVFAPIQPALGVLAVVVAAFGLRRRLTSGACEPRVIDGGGGRV